MLVPSALAPSLQELVSSLDALGTAIDRSSAIALVAGASISPEDVRPFVVENEASYHRHRIARTEHFEVLIMTWRPGQGSAPHDHAGSLCALKVIEGSLGEMSFTLDRDGLVSPGERLEMREGEVLVDTSGGAHALGNTSSDKLLVTLHVYSPPLPELRRFALREHEVRAAFERSAAPSAMRVTVVGGGFSGTITAANLIAVANERGVPLHLTLIDRQAAFGEGAAYRTADGRHLLNVPAGNMSAWPERPDDFCAWLEQKQMNLGPRDFAPRRIYGEYVRSCFDRVLQHAKEPISVEIVRAAATRIETRAEGPQVHTDDGRLIDAECVVLATGHRPPDDPLARRFDGPRTRYIEDPWASLALSAIAPDESVILLGTGLTAVDVLLTLHRSGRTAPTLAISRRGLLPRVHASTPVPRRDPTPWLEPLLNTPGALTARSLTRAVRRSIAQVSSEGGDWRSVIDGLRPHTPRIWRALPRTEADRLMRHVRSFWEVHRHRTAPSIGENVAALMASGSLSVAAGRLRGARADPEGVELDWCPRGARTAQTSRAAWIVNCTGPGSGRGVVPVVASLLEQRGAQIDPLGIGLVTDEHGRVQVDGATRNDLFVVGTLRKPACWESTAVPELREQARETADRVLSSRFSR